MTKTHCRVTEATTQVWPKLTKFVCLMAAMDHFFHFFGPMWARLECPLWNQTADWRCTVHGPPAETANTTLAAFLNTRPQGNPINN